MEQMFDSSKICAFLLKVQMRYRKLLKNNLEDFGRPSEKVSEISYSSFWKLRAASPPIDSYRVINFPCHRLIAAKMYSVQILKLEHVQFGLLQFKFKTNLKQNLITICKIHLSFCSVLPKHMCTSLVEVKYLKSNLPEEKDPFPVLNK